MHVMFLIILFDAPCQVIKFVSPKLEPMLLCLSHAAPSGDYRIKLLLPPEQLIFCSNPASFLLLCHATLLKATYFPFKPCEHPSSLSCHLAQSNFFSVQTLQTSYCPVMPPCSKQLIFRSNPANILVHCHVILLKATYFLFNPANFLLLRYATATNVS
jgi:hypothetical protein